MLFSLAGHLYISQDLMVIFLHCVGFGFFLVLTTQQARWLGALALGGIAFAIATYQLIPEDWLVISHNIANYTGLATVFIIGVFCRTVQTPESILRNEILASVRSNILENVGIMRDKVALMSLRVRDRLGSFSFGKPRAGAADESPESMLMRASKRKLTHVLIDMDAKLADHEERIKEAKLKVKQQRDACDQLRSTLDHEVSRRLCLERENATKTARLESLQQRAHVDGISITKLKRELMAQKRRADAAESRSAKHEKDAIAAADRARELENKINPRARFAVRELASAQKRIVVLRKEVADLRAAAAVAAAAKVGLDDSAGPRKDPGQQRGNDEGDQDDDLMWLHDTDAPLPAAPPQRPCPSAAIVEHKPAALAVLPLPELKVSIRVSEKNLALLRGEYEKRLHVQQEKLEERARRILCCVCLDSQIEVMCDPCGHVCVCKGCARDLKACPLCREGIRCVKPVFYGS